MSKEAIALLIMVVCIAGLAAHRYRTRNERRPKTSNEDKAFRTAPRWAGVLNEKMNMVLAGQRRLHQHIGSEADADEERDLKIMTVLTDAVDAIEASAQANSDVADSAEAAFTRLATMIEDLRTGVTDQPTIDRITALAAAVRDRAARLGIAVAATPT